MCINCCLALAAESYPSTVPEVLVRSQSLTPDNNEELKRLLTEQAGKWVGAPMMQKLVCVAETWLRSHGIRPGRAVDASTEVFLDSGKKKPKKRKSRKKKGEEEEEDAKKPSMKTADDVIKRILWDDKLDKDDFLVGYLDRFRGIVEKYFSAFSWEDIASVDYDVLAVPRHRIQYFKYRSQKVWDKPSRMDNVFGSTGSGMTVYDVINNYQEPSETAGNGNAAAVSAEACREDEDESNTDSDDSDDDGITITIGSSVNTTSQADDEAGEVGSSYDPFWQDKMRPNYFLALRIMDPEIRQGVEQIQDYLLDNEPLYGPCCIPPQALHITLCTLGLNTPEQVAHAKEVLECIQPELATILPKQPLKIEGVSDFYNRVIYAKVHHEQGLMDFVNHLKLLVKEAGLEIRDNHDFVPHMTIMKVTRPVARQKRSKNVDPWLYSNFRDMYFGRQHIDAIHLCSMGDERRDDGFYACPAEIHFQWKNSSACSAQLHMTLDQ